MGKRYNLRRITDVVLFFLMSFWTLALLSNRAGYEITAKKVSSAHVKKIQHDMILATYNLPLLSPRVPFYLYDEPEFQAFWNDCDSEAIGLGLAGLRADHFAYLAAKRSPWRVMDPESALLFVVPIPWSHISRIKVWKQPNNGQCKNISKHLKSVVEVLNNSTYLIRNGGNDHITPNNDYWGLFLLKHFTDIKTEKRLRSLLKVMLRMSFLAPADDNGCTVIVPYTTAPIMSSLLIGSETLETTSVQNLGELAELGRRYVHERKYTLGFVGRTTQGVGPGYNMRRAFIEHVEMRNYRSPNVLVSIKNKKEEKLLPQCTESQLSNCWSSFDPELFRTAVTESKYCLYLRGDDPSSARLYDCIAAGTITVVVSDGLPDFTLPFQCEVDWPLLLIHIPTAEFNFNPIAALDAYLPNETTRNGLIDIGAKLAEIHRVQKILLFEHPQSVAFEMSLRETVRKCISESFLTQWNNRFLRGINDSLLHPSRSVRQGSSKDDRISSVYDIPCPFTDVSKPRHSLLSAFFSWET